MRIAKNLRLSLQALAVHRLRAALAVAGAAVGVAGVVALTAVGTGARNAVIRRIEALGRNMIVITPGQADALPGRARQGEGSVQNLRLDDAHAILRGTAAIRRAAPALDGGMSAKFGRIMTPVTVLGTTPDWRAIRQFDIAQGRFFTDDENAARVRVAVLGADARN
ncbi:MAG: ABC transporter permease, partial [Longimicrobiales bacterium]